MKKKVELVRGMGPKLTTETESLLRQRLKTVVLILALGATAFFIRNRIIGSPLPVLNLVVTIWMVVCTVVLFSSRAFHYPGCG